MGGTSSCSLLQRGKGFERDTVLETKASNLFYFYCTLLEPWGIPNLQCKVEEAMPTIHFPVSSSQMKGICFWPSQTSFTLHEAAHSQQSKAFQTLEMPSVLTSNRDSRLNIKARLECPIEKLLQLRLENRCT